MKLDRLTIRGDFLGGIASAAVMLPLALSFGIASGMGAVAGLHGAVALGFGAAVFGGTRSQISGPTAAMTVAMWAVVTSYAHNVADALTAVVLAGLIQVILGLARVGRFAAYTPRVIVSGLMSGFGAIIILVQLPPFLGAPLHPGGLIGTMWALPDALANIRLSALAIAAVTLAIGFLWPHRLARFAPGPLVALVVGTLMGVLWLTSAPVIGELPTESPSIRLAVPITGVLLDALEPALMLALLGAVDTLLVALATDSLTGKRHDPGRELVGQGIGNTIAGLLGALPGSGASLGTVTNIRSGGSSPWSGVICALTLLALVPGLGRLAEPIPIAALAGVTIKAGWDIIDWRLLFRLHRISGESLLVLLTTLGLTVFVDPITAAAIGLIAGGMVHARRLEQLELDRVVFMPMRDETLFDCDEDMAAGSPIARRVGLVALSGDLTVATVASSNKLVNVVGPEIRDHEVLIFDFTDTTYIDESAAMVIERLLEVATASDTDFVIKGLHGSGAATIREFDVLRGVPGNRKVATLGEARQAARDLLGTRSRT